MTGETALPAGFEDLQPLVAEWALRTQDRRAAKRLSSTMEAVRAFYDAIFPRMEAVMDHLALFRPRTRRRCRQRRATSITSRSPISRRRTRSSSSGRR